MNNRDWKIVYVVAVASIAAILLLLPFIVVIYG